LGKALNGIASAHGRRQKKFQGCGGGKGKRLKNSTIKPLPEGENENGKKDRK